jgi:hypothetical protein
MPIDQVGSITKPKFSRNSGHPDNAKSTGSFLDFHEIH